MGKDMFFFVFYLMNWWIVCLTASCLRSFFYFLQWEIKIYQHFRECVVLFSKHIVSKSKFFHIVYGPPGPSWKNVVKHGNTKSRKSIRKSGQLHRDHYPRGWDFHRKGGVCKGNRTPKCPKDSGLGFLARNFPPKKKLVPHSKFSGFFIYVCISWESL